MSDGVKGLGGILKNLRLVKKDKGKNLERGLVLAGLFLQRKSQQVVPVDTGNLKGSAFTRKTKKGLDPVVTVGYTAEYAVYVHENQDAEHKPGKIAKFLERPARDNWDRMQSIITGEMGKGK